MPFQLYKLGPNWELAELHGMATMPGIVQSSSYYEEELCPCCYNTIYKDKAPLCDNSKQLEFLGFGFPLYFVFIKYCIVLLLILIASYNFITLYWAIIFSNALCATYSIDTYAICTNTMVKWSRIEPIVTQQEIMLRISSFCIQMALLIYIRDLLTKTRAYYDYRTCSLSDYSVLLSGLANGNQMRRKLSHMLKSAFYKSYDHAHIIFLADYKYFYSLLAEHYELVEREKKCLSSYDSNTIKLLKRIREEKEEIKAKVEEECTHQIEQDEDDRTVMESLIFSCLSEKDREGIMTGFNYLPEYKIREYFEIPYDQKCEIIMDEAPDPRYIEWENVTYPKGKRKIRMVISWLMTLLFLGAVTAVFFFVLSLKSQILLSIASGQHNREKEIETIILVYAALITVILFNKLIMGAVLHKLCHFEHHSTTTALEFHFALKYSVGMFFTTALMTLAVEDIRFHNFYAHYYGVIEYYSIMFFMSALFVPLIWFINPWQCWKLIQRKMNYLRKDLTQSQANKIMYNTQYSIGKRYAEIIYIMWFTFLYSSLIPFGAFASVIGLSLYYWIDKYNLLRRSSVNANISGYLSYPSMRLLDFTLLAKPLGEIIFDSQIRDSYNIVSIVLSVIALLYLFAPLDDILTFFHSEYFKLEYKAYYEVYGSFKETYETMHPILSLKGSIFGSSNGGTINVFNLMEETVHVVVKGGNKISPHENFYTKKQILFQSEKIELQSPTPLFIKDNYDKSKKDTEQPSLLAYLEKNKGDNGTYGENE